MPRPAKKARASTQNLPNRTRAAQALASPNTKWIATFSSALLLEITSYFHQMSFADVLDNPTTLRVKYRERFDILRALSQTCRDLRGVCLLLARSMHSRRIVRPVFQRDWHCIREEKQGDDEMQTLVSPCPVCVRTPRHPKTNFV